MGRGDCFGEIGLIHHSPRTATVRAVTDCVFYRFKGTEFLAAVNESPLVVRAVLAMAGGRLARSHLGRTERLAPPNEPGRPIDPSAPSP
jgi:CRP-like cAMP-binding protein